MLAHHWVMYVIIATAIWLCVCVICVYLLNRNYKAMIKEGRKGKKASRFDLVD